MRLAPAFLFRRGALVELVGEDRGYLVAAVAVPIQNFGLRSLL
jgi:hypothetical protein